MSEKKLQEEEKEQRVKKKYKTFDELPLFLKIEDMADILQLSETKAREIAYSDGFPIMDRQLTGRRIVIPKLAFMRWAEEKTIIDYLEKEV